VSLEVSAEKAEYMFMSRRQNVGQNQNIKTINYFSVILAKLMHVKTTVTNRSSMYEEVTVSLYSGE
jgi:hypothetical protein